MTFVKQMLSQINIDVEVLPMESATISDKIYVEKDEAEVNMWYVNLSLIHILWELISRVQEQM